MNEMSLKALHERLHAHFSWLRDQRGVPRPDRPIFALEHGLDGEDREALATVVRDAIARGLHPRKEWLPYVVYATELGYQYTGDEYWHTFETQSPGWKERGDRSYIRRKFRAFADEFGGAIPSGPWAEHFSIIAWPITHAVLPTDLQRHLARLLYEMRHEISLDLLASPDQLGRRLSSRTLYTSSRFQKFAENKALLGLVAAALLSDEQEDSPTLLKPTLDRIVADLSSERQAKSWLRGARRSTTEMRVRGVARRPSEGSDRSDGQRDPSRRPASTDPNLWLQMDADGWALELELPDLSELGSRLPQIQEELSRKRCRISGRRQPLARGRILYPGQRIRLDMRPQAGGTVLEVENGSAELQEVLRDHCLLPPPPWLFRIDDGGTGREIRGKFVRPGIAYVYVAPTPLSFECPAWISPVDFLTNGLVAYKLEVPSLLDPSSAPVFTRLGLRSSVSLAIGPIGVVPASWDGEGVIAWMVGDDPVIAVQSSRQPTAATFTLDGSPTSVAWPPGESCLYLRFDPMDVGTHQIRLHVTFADHATAPVDGELSVMIRPRPSGTLSSRYGLRLFPTPAQPHLTELWDGDAFVEVQGPAGTEVRVQCDFRSRSPDRSLRKHSFRLKLPADRSDWLRTFRQEVQQNTQIQDVYDDAEVCCMSVFHRDVGIAEVRAERPFTPLRWAVHSNGAGTTARLINNSGANEPEMRLYSRESPAQPITVPLGADEEEAIYLSTGGLLVAETGEVSAAVILPPKVHDLADLREISEQPVLRQYSSRSDRTLQSIIKDCGRWLTADLPANLAAQRLLHTVVRAFAGRLCELVGGQYWSRVERQVRDEPEDLHRNAFTDAMGRHPSDKELAKDIWRDVERLRQLQPEQRAQSLAQKVGAFVHVPGNLALDAESVESVLQLVSEPGRLAMKAETATDAAIGLVLERPIVLRAARMTVLCVHVAEDRDDGSVYRGWTWQ